MAEFLSDYVRQWAQDNVHYYPFEDKAHEVLRLVGRLYEDAFKLGHEQKDMDDQRVEVLEFIQRRFDQVQHGDLGTKDRG